MLFEDYSAHNTTVTSVSELNHRIHDLLDGTPDLQNVTVRGEVSNAAFPASGHVYFTLKDSLSSIKCVLWRTYANGAKKTLVNGCDVEVHGKVSVFERDGAYQLYADHVQTVGVGNLYEQFLRLKEKLEKEGLFDPSQKQALPTMPKKIGVVTSATGAALQDIINTLRGRWPLCEVLLSPAAVQGAEAPLSLQSAFSRLVQENPDVIIIARGGGSIEDLWGFNDEGLARLIAACTIPVVSGVGHETDFTLTDFVADVRAPTPTGAAVLASPDIHDLSMAIDQWTMRLDEAIESRTKQLQQTFKTMNARLAVQAPLKRVAQERKDCEELKQRLTRASEANLIIRKQTLQACLDRLNNLNPDAVLQRGYAIIQDPQQHIISALDSLSQHKRITIRLADGSADTEIINLERHRLNKTTLEGIE